MVDVQEDLVEETRNTNEACITKKLQRERASQSSSRKAIAQVATHALSYLHIQLSTDPATISNMAPKTAYQEMIESGLDKGVELEDTVRELTATTERLREQRNILQDLLNRPEHQLRHRTL